MFSFKLCFVLSATKFYDFTGYNLPEIKTEKDFIDFFKCAEKEIHKLEEKIQKVTIINNAMLEQRPTSFHYRMFDFAADLTLMEEYKKVLFELRKNQIFNGFKKQNKNKCNHFIVRISKAYNSANVLWTKMGVKKCRCDICCK